MRNFYLIFILVLIPGVFFAQEGETELEYKNVLTGTFGYSFVAKGTEVNGTEAKGVLVPSIGIDYFRKLNPKWDVGMMIDLELADYLIFEKDLNRSKALVVTAIVAHNFTEHITLYGGGGMELEKHENLLVARFGVEYAFKYSSGWVLAPGFFYDVKEGYDTWSISLAFGKEF